MISHPYEMAVPRARNAGTPNCIAPTKTPPKPSARLSRSRVRWRTRRRSGLPPDLNGFPQDRSPQDVPEHVPTELHTPRTRGAQDVP